MYKQIYKLFLAMALLLTASACDNTRVVDGQRRDLSIRYKPSPATGEDGSLFRVGANYGVSFAQTLRRLRQSGFEIISSDRSTGEIQAESNVTTLVDCGRVGVGSVGEATIFPANAPLSLLEVPAGAEGSTFLKRRFNTHTSVSVRLGQSSLESGVIFAAINESHVAKLTLLQAGNDTVVFEQTIQFSGAESGRFRRGVSCGSSGQVREIVSGN